jgi:hypothetical protein
VFFKIKGRKKFRGLSGKRLLGKVYRAGADVVTGR